MATFSTNLGLTLIATGDQAGTWGTTTNTNLGTLLEQAISGYVTQAITDGADTTITIPNGATGVARNMYIECTGTLSANRNLVVPTNKKLYFIYNNTSGGFAVTVKVSGQTGVSVPNGEKKILVSNGTDIVEATSYGAIPTSLTLTTLTATSANITTLTGTTFSPTTLTATSASITTVTGTTAGFTSANITTLTGTTFSPTTLTATSATITTVTGTTAGFTSANITTLTGTTLGTFASGAITNLTSSSATITTLTGTTLGAFTSGTITNLSAGDVTFTSSVISTSGTNQNLTIDPNGTGIVLIGSSTSTGIYPNGVAVEIIADSGGVLYPLLVQSKSQPRAGITNWNTATSGDNQFISFGTEASFTARGSVSYNRAAGQVAYNTTSDRRAKVIEGPVTNSGQIVDELNVYTGRMVWGDISLPMMIADEAMQVTPYCVTGQPNAVDEKGNPVYQQMDYSALVPLLLAEIQSLRARVAALEGP